MKLIKLKGIQLMALTIFSMSEKVSEILHLPKKTVFEYTRKLRNAGLIRTSGRGGVPLKMESTDVANLILGLMCSDTAVDAPEAVKSIRSGICKMAHMSETPDEKTHVDDFPEAVPFAYLKDNNGDMKTFGEVMDTLTTLLSKSNAELDNMKDDKGNSCDGLSIKIWRNVGTANIGISSNDQDWSLEYAPLADYGTGGYVTEIWIDALITFMCLKRVGQEVL